MVIDLTYLVYSILIVYTVVGTLALGLAILGARRLTVYLKGLNREGEKSGKDLQGLGHPPLAHNGVAAR